MNRNITALDSKTCDKTHDKSQQILDKQSQALVGGGEERYKKQREKGKMSARQRLQVLLDASSDFHETDMLIEHRCDVFGMKDNVTPGDGVVTGCGYINGRKVGVASQDFTVYGGSLGEMHAKKICKVMDLATSVGMPMVCLNDSGGARIQEGVDSLNGYAEIFKRNAKISGYIPQISLILGPCAGGAVYSPALTDFIIMTRDTSYMFVTGPDVIKKVMFEELTQESLGGSSVHGAKTGIADIVADNEVDALLLTRKLLTYLPSNCNSGVVLSKCSDPVSRESLALETVVPLDSRQSYDMLDVITSIVDYGDFFEIQRDYAKNVIVGFCRIGGRSVGIVANQPIHLAGCLDINSSRKAARFVRFCDAFNIPLLTLVDVPGFMPGSYQEHNGIIAHGAKLVYAYGEATVPRVTVVVRKAYGGAYIVMNSSGLGGDINLAWPSAEIAVMGAEGAVEIIFRKHSGDAEKVASLTGEYTRLFANPLVAAGRGYINSVIRPGQTRAQVHQAFELLSGKKHDALNKKHDNLPL